MANAAGFKIIGRSGNTAGMGGFFCLAFIITFMTGNAVHRQMEILADQFLIYQITFVIFFRPDRGRGASSPFGLAAYFRRLNQCFHFIGVGVALDTPSSVGFGC
jgi:hypothetical protein